MSVRRRVASLALLIGTSAAILIAASGSGWGLRQATLTIAQGPPVTKDYPPLPASDPNPFFSSPSQCNTAASCDTIPLEIKVPDIAANDDFYVRITLSWDDRRVGGQQGNDLALRLYEGANNIARSTTSQQPEVILIYRPVGKDYALTVINSTGVNTGYRITGEMILESIESPSEFQDGSAPPPDLSATPEETAPPPTAESTVEAQPGAPVPLAPDPALADLNQSSGQLRRFLGSPSALLDAGPQSTGPPKPVSGSQVLLWTIVPPLALAVAGALWIRLKSPGTLARL